MYLTIDLSFFEQKASRSNYRFAITNETRISRQQPADYVLGKTGCYRIYLLIATCLMIINFALIFGRVVVDFIQYRNSSRPTSWRCIKYMYTDRYVYNKCKILILILNNSTSSYVN